MYRELGCLAATLALALLAGTGREVRATRVDPERRVRMEPDSTGHDSRRRSGGMAPRFYSMAHIAMFDAVNAIEREFEPYRVRLRRPGPRIARGRRGAGRARRARRRSTRPRLPSMMRLLARQLGTKPSDFERRGAAVGAWVAKEVLAWRQNDGWVVAGAPAVRRAASSRALAADAAEQPGRDVHPSSERRADGAVDVHAVSCRPRRRRSPASGTRPT